MIRQKRKCLETTLQLQWITPMIEWHVRCKSHAPIGTATALLTFPAAIVCNASA